MKLMLKTYIIAVLLGLLFSLGFAPNDLWFISIFSLTCLHYLIQEANKKELFWIGYSFGFGIGVGGVGAREGLMMYFVGINRYVALFYYSRESGKKATSTTSSTKR